uniref:NADPH oxidase n=1 Tax=Fusarium oxysporum (strain Fo5176) TaxID=660025 RepID=A0A0D2Y8X0_FUSOF
MSYQMQDWGEKPSERSRWTPLTRMLLSGEMTQEKQQELSSREKFDRWMINEGYRRFLKTSNELFGFTFVIARSAALVLHVDVAVILFPVSRTLISLLRQTPLNGILQFDKNITFHIVTAWSIVFWSWVHTIAHWNNFAQVAIKYKLGIYGWLVANFVSGPGWTGYVMLIALMGMVLTSTEKPRRANFERFWYTHHMFIVFFFFWSIHGAFCMIQPDVAPFCTNVGASAVGVFWQYWMYSGFIYLAERIAREVRGRHRTYITKVIQHPSNVCEIQMKKEHTKTRAGQYIFVCCPAVSLWQYHLFTLTSAREEDYISVHIRCVGDFNKGAFPRLLGCDWSKRRAPRVTTISSKVVWFDWDATTEIDPAIRRCSPQKSTSDRSFLVLAPKMSSSMKSRCFVGAGYPVLHRSASILKSIWYRMNYPQKKDPPSQGLLLLDLPVTLTPSSGSAHCFWQSKRRIWTTVLRFTPTSQPRSRPTMRQTS